MWIAPDWRDYRLLDCGGGERLERWGKYTLARPDPQAIWPRTEPELWKRADAVYHRSSTGGGRWEIRSLPESWTIGWREQTFNIKPMSFKHTRRFSRSRRPTGTSLHSRCARPGVRFPYSIYLHIPAGRRWRLRLRGASVCHVDAARGMVAWARENAKSSGLSDAPVRYIVDDCKKFVQREIKPRPALRRRYYGPAVLRPRPDGRGVEV